MKDSVDSTTHEEHVCKPGKYLGVDIQVKGRNLVKSERNV